MAHRKLTPKPSKAGVLRGKTLTPPVTVADRYNRVLQRNIDDMLKEVKREVLALWAAEVENTGMDANAASQARILTNALTAKFDSLFSKLATPTAEKMVDDVDAQSAATLRPSLKDLAANMSFKTNILNEGLREVLTASVVENVNLIKRIPQKYLGQVQSLVMRSIQVGDVNLTRELDKYGVQIKNWSKNVALDQTRKAYAGINAGRMKALGVKKFEWVHTGGSANPRQYHKNVLNGNIYSFDDLPVIDPNTGERGIPAQLPYCRCRMRPVIEID